MRHHVLKSLIIMLVIIGSSGAGSPLWPVSASTTMNRSTITLAASAITPTPTPTVAGAQPGNPGDEGLILYHVYDETGHQFGRELVMANAKGQELGRIYPPDFLEQGRATPLNGQVVYQTTEKRLYLLDTASGITQRLEFAGASGGEASPPTIEDFHFNRQGLWAFINDWTSPLAYLVNLETGQVEALTDPAAEISDVSFDEFSPDGNYVAFKVDDTIWVAPTADPGAVRHLKGVDNVSFSQDSQQIVYQRRTASDELEIVLERVDGSDSKVILSGAEPARVEFVPNQPQLILSRPGHLSLFSLAGNQEQILLTDVPLSGVLLRFAPDGQKVLVMEDTSFGGSYYFYWLDLQQATAQELDSLFGYELIMTGEEGKAFPWLFFWDRSNYRFASLNLESGQVHQLLDLESVDLSQFLHLATFSPDDKFGLIIAKTWGSTSSPATKQLWLLPALGGEARLLAEAQEVHGAFSPDSRWVAVSTVDYPANRAKANLELVAVEGEQTVPLGEGFGAVWLPPARPVAKLDQKQPPVPVGSPYAQVWTWLGGNTGRLGTPLAPAVSNEVAWQRFEGGLMHWGWQDETGQPQIHVLISGDTQARQRWERFSDTWTEGAEPYPCAQAGPPLGPRRGFGQVWCQAQAIRDALGAPLEEERNEAGGYQTFRGGVMLWSPEEEGIYVLFDQGDWWWVPLAKVSTSPPLWQTWSDLGTNFVRLAAAPDGSIWAVGQNGLDHFNDKTRMWQTFPLPDELKANGNKIRDLVVATDGTVWLGAGNDWPDFDQGAIYRFDSKNWTRYDSAGELTNDAILELAIDAQNQVWAMSPNILSHFDGQNWQVISVGNQGQELPDLESLAVTPAGTVWLAISGEQAGIYRYDGQTWTVYNHQTQPDDDFFKFSNETSTWIAAGADDHVWVFTDRGSVAHWNGQTWQRPATRIPARFSIPVTVDAAGGVWSWATLEADFKIPDFNENGAVYVNLDIACRFTAADGLNGPALQPLPDYLNSTLIRPDKVEDIIVAPDGSVWFVAGGQITVFHPQGPVCDYAASEQVRMPEAP